MAIPSNYWDTRLTEGQWYAPEFRTRYRDLSDAIDDAYDTFDASTLIPSISNKEALRGYLVAGEGFAAWLSNNLLGSASPLGGDNFENPYSFNFGEADKESFLRSLGCRANPRDMCRAYENRAKTGLSVTAGVSYTLFGLALCDPGVREDLGNNYDAFEWNVDGSLNLYDRYNFTDLEDFGGVENHGMIKVVVANVFGKGLGGLVGILNNSGIPEAVQEFFNVARNEPDYDAEPYFTWRGDGASFTVTSITRTNRTVTVTTSEPHGITNENGGGIKIVEGDGTATSGNTFNIPDTGDQRIVNGVNVTVVDENTLRYYDPFDRPDYSSDGSGVTAVQKNRWGKAQMMYTVDTFTKEDLLNYNPELFFDAIARGLIPNILIPGALEVGDKQPNPIVAGIAGLIPQAPVKITTNPTNFSFNYPNYPQPYNSWSQAVVNATYHLGPYAKLNKLVIDKSEGGGTCYDEDEWGGEKIDSENPFYGRLAILTSGPHAGDVGFFIQPWYDFEDGPYNTDDGTAEGTPFESKAEWWRGSVKSRVKVRFAHLSSQPLTTVEVAYSSSGFDSPLYFKGQDLGAQPDYTVELVAVLVAAAALSGIVF